MMIGKIEYRVRPITRYIVTRFEQNVEETTGGSEQKGEFENDDVAYAVAYALCKEEQSRLNLSDDKIIYPQHPSQGAICLAPIGQNTLAANSR